ncbi:MAG: hypothetical protein JO053_08825 [Acidobacteria bacterium]|nr:hypothetical protein [Acidobacteriota bacterium]
MFEQSSYDIEPAAEPTQAGDLFHNYEIKNWDYNPRLYKIAAIAGAANLLALIIVAQTSLLTMKGCDSPLVSGVCQALDVVDLGKTMLFGAPRDWVDKEYQKTDLGDMDITYVDVSGDTPPLSYPDGYFQIANPDEFQASMENPANPFDPASPNYTAPGAVPPGIPITTPNTGAHLIDTKPVTPKTNKNPLNGSLPDSIGDETASNNGNGKGKGKDKNPQPTPEATPVDPNTIVDSVNPGEINKKPFVLYANSINKLVDEKQVNLESVFSVTASGKLNKDGRIDPKSWKWKPGKTSDPKILDVVKDGIVALNDSGLLMYLSLLQGQNCDLLVQQDGTKFTVVVQSDLGDQNHANTIKDGLRGAISIAKMGKGGPNASQNQLDDLMLLNSATVDADGKKVVLKFEVPTADAMKLIQRKLTEQRAAANSPSGNALGSVVNRSGL